MITVEKALIIGLAIAYEPATVIEGAVVHIAIPFFIFRITLNTKK